MPRKAMRRVAVAVWAACAPPTWAAQGWLGFGLGAEYSDNINLAPEGEEEDGSVAVASASMNVTERTADVDAQLTGTLQYRDYQTDIFDDEFLLNLEARGVWTLVPGRYTWHLEDYFDQAAVDVFAAPTPANLQDANVFSTGPEGHWRLSSSQSIIAGGRYGNFYFEESEADSYRLSGYGRFLYAMSQRTDLSANAEVSVVKYTEDSYEDYDRGDAFLRLMKRWSRSDLEADAGTTFIRRDRNDDINGFLGRAALHTALNSYSRVDLGLEHQYTDVGHDILETAMRDGAIGVLDEQITGDLFYIRQVEAGYHWDGGRIFFGLRGAVRDEDYDTTRSDRSYETGRLEIGYNFSSSMRATLSGIYRRSDYREVDQVSNDNEGGLRFDYQINSRMAAALEATHTKRDSNPEEAAYEENRVMLTFTYDRVHGFEPPAEGE